MICEEFKRKAHAGTHYCELEGQHMWSMMFTNGEGESCAINGTDEEVALLLTNVTETITVDNVANSFVMIGDSASEWEVEEKRTALIDRALQIIKERDGQ